MIEVACYVKSRSLEGIWGRGPELEFQRVLGSRRQTNRKAFSWGNLVIFADLKSVIRVQSGA